MRKIKKIKQDKNIKQKRIATLKDKMIGTHAYVEMCQCGFDPEPHKMQIWPAAIYG